MIRIILSVLIFCLAIQPVHAQSDTSSFLIKVFGGEDIVAPTTPTLSGAAIAPSQIDLSWTTSVDNFVVSGYVLYRDGLPVATTTQTTYSDVGLSASTTYTYFIQAFDPSFNYSSSSNIVSIFTPQLPSPPQAGESAGGTATRVVLNSLDIEARERSAQFSITTVRPARFEVRWGRTTSYELGYTVNDVFVSSYKTTLTDLEPGTVYQYEVVGYTPFGMATVLERGQFSTISLADSFPPTNVGAFQATREGTNVKLNWLVPVGSDIASVKIVRSHLGFPAHSQDGVVVYQGLAESAVDVDILSQYSPVYYTAFAIDAAGNVSSGAVARVYALKDGVVDDGVSNPPIPSGTDGAQEETIASTSPSVTPGTRMPGLDEIFVKQNETRQTLAVQGIVLDSETPLLLSIPKSAISDNLKTIIASLTDPTDSRRAYSFMLRLNKDQTAYEAILPPTMLEGKSRLTIDIYDFGSLVVATYQKTLEFKAGEATEVVPVFPDKIIGTFASFGWVVAIPVVFLLLLILLLRRRRASLEDNL